MEDSSINNNNGGDLFSVYTTVTVSSTTFINNDFIGILSSNIIRVSKCHFESNSGNLLTAKTLITFDSNNVNHHKGNIFIPFYNDGEINITSSSFSHNHSLIT